MKKYDEENLTPEEFSTAAYSKICAALVATIHIITMLKGDIFNGVWRTIGSVLLFLFEMFIFSLGFNALGIWLTKEHKYNTLKEQRKFLFVILPLILVVAFLVYISYLNYK